MPETNQQPRLPSTGSLLDDLGPAPAAPRPRAQDQLRIILGRLRRDEDMKWARRVGAIALACIVLVCGTMGVMALIPRPVPSYLDDPMDDVLDFTLLSSDFNKLPLEKRLALIKDLIQRLKTMSSSDSADMAAFAAGIKEQMRKQVEQNTRQFAADVLESYARDYVKVPPDHQREFLDQTIIGFTRMMEDLSGDNSGLPEDEGQRVAKIKQQAKRDRDRMKQDDKGLSPGRAARLLEFIHRNDANVSGPVERGHMAKFMRDMTRHLRGEDPATGKPLPEPPG